MLIKADSIARFKKKMSPQLLLGLMVISPFVARMKSATVCGSRVLRVLHTRSLCQARCRAGFALGRTLLASASGVDLTHLADLGWPMTCGHPPVILLWTIQPILRGALPPLPELPPAAVVVALVDLTVRDGYMGTAPVSVPLSCDSIPYIGRRFSQPAHRLEVSGPSPSPSSVAPTGLAEWGWLRPARSVRHRTRRRLALAHSGASANSLTYLAVALHRRGSLRERGDGEF